MEIVSLQIKNFMSIKDVELKCGQINLIQGKNANGKTTILKALETAVKGSSNKNLVKIGEDRAEIIVELPDDTKIRRTINANGNQNVTVSKGDFEVKSPQTYLKNLFNFNSFNPLELLSEEKRTESILNAIHLTVEEEDIASKLGVKKEDLPMGVDFKDHGLKVIDSLYKIYYANRAKANKETLEKKNRFESYKKDIKEVEAPKFDKLKISAEKEAINQSRLELAKEEAIAGSSKNAAEEGRKKLDTFKLEMSKIDNEISQYQEDIAILENKIALCKGRKEAGAKAIEELQSSLEKQPIPDLTAFEVRRQELNVKESELTNSLNEIAAYETHQKLVDTVKDMESEYEKFKKESDKLDNIVKLLAGPIKKELMEGVDLPIGGLEFIENQIYIKGVHVDNLSTAQTLVLAISLAREVCKTTKAICVDGAEVLDEETFKTLIENIKGDGYTYFITRWTESSEIPEGVNVITMKQGEVQ